uniref:Reverse transcriptase domain-containing protein n=1 Tax=Chromera velia CCMP2878 TaxID=1169474 RepID=A0A0G4HKD4_9ALVE|eukprot:Cvel_28390.t1-p1 / transcript=Cvel_28390.t1 / gene=Cvel_28390 / organism=Chromera_velia_CCMP2878 / gene_product=Retrovirus-related Pol polyprotein from transposon, putative / transcript_product=Retrovirus-related Pol polyprotein from transposon, putative / location=Cvel_scaffold3707:2127-6193(-) / protein_length=686 / sequence_SO=supercontig / SO=protein_coding / is_pseudo=false
MRGTALTWWTSEMEEKVETLKTIENLHACFEAQFGITEAEKDAAEDLLDNLVQDAPVGETIRTYAERMAALCRQARVSRNDPKILKKLFKKGIFNETVRTILATKTYSSLDEIVKEAEKLAHANSPNSSNAVAASAFTPPTMASVARATATALYAPATPPRDLEEGLQQLLEVGALDSTSCMRYGEEDEGAEEQALPPPFVSATTSAAATGGSTQGSTLHAPSMSALGQMELKGGETWGQNPAAWPDELTKEEKEKAEAEIDKALEDCEHLSAKQKKELKDLLLEYRDFFSTDRNPGNIKGVEARVDVETDTPIYERPRPVPHALRAELQEGLQKLLEGGIIKPTSSPWGFPLVLIWKKTGKLRICIDYRKLNKILRKDRWPLPRIDHTLAKLQGRRFYTLIDLFQGFHHVSVREDHQERLSFVIADGQFTYCKMPFSISTAPSIFQRAMDIMLAGLTGSFVSVYLDDILVASFSFEEHLTHIRKTLDRLRTSGCKLSFTKCSWAQTSLLYLGHIVDTTGIRPNPKKALHQGLLADRFPPHFPTQKAHTPFVWEEPQRRAFEALKEALTSEPVLCHPDFDKGFVVKPDASNDAIGAVLGQTNEERNEKVVAYASRMMTDFEKKWGITEREALSLVYAVDTFKPYLYGKKFTVITDHKALQHIHDQKDSQPRVMKWALKLAIYEFDV